MSLFDNLPHLVTIYGPPTVAKDTSGADEITWPTVRATGIACLIRQGAGDERDEFNQSQRPRSTHTIAFGCQDGGVQPGDKLVNVRTGATYRYTGGKPQEGVGGIDDFNTISVTEMEPSS